MVFGWSRAWVAGAASALLCWAFHGQALAAENGGRFLGSSSCASSTCHGATSNWTYSDVQQNEFVLWSTHDPHSKAYRALESEKGKRIAANLGIADAAADAGCLACHAGNAPADRRGPKYDVRDGVGCESCHGAAENWLRGHVATLGNHEANLKAGLRKLEDPGVRARTCLACHAGSAERPMTHAMHGAGHPRLQFEAETFFTIEPAHVRIDFDYVARKGHVDKTRAWAVGQVAAAQAMLAVAADPARNHDGFFPALAIADCFACHRSVAEGRAGGVPRPDGLQAAGAQTASQDDVATDERGVAIGRTGAAVRPNVAAFAMSAIVADVFDRDLSGLIAAAGASLAAASNAGPEAMAAAAREAAPLIARLDEKLAGHRFSEAETKALLARLSTADPALSDRFVVAEQTTMASANLVAVLRGDAAPGTGRTADIDRALAGLYEAVRSSDTFSPQRFRAAQAKMAKALASIQGPA